MWLAIALAGVVALASYELLRAVKAAPRPYMYGITAVAAASIPVGFWAGKGSVVVYGAALLLLITLFFTAIRHFDDGENTVHYEQIMVCFFGGLLVPVCLSALVQLRMMENGRFLVLIPVICASITDVGAYFVGMLFGKHRGITKVSPNKSLEGYIGGIVVGCLVLMLYAFVLHRFVGLEVSMPIMAFYGIVGSAVTELGDLSFSLIKRQVGVKDYGKLLPGHGGMMDRFDSTVFAAPAILVLVWLMPAF
jgi:phosphatidate cytidylyltransferase